MSALWKERQASKDIELLCDSEVVKNYTKEEKKQYSEMLLAFAGGYKYNSYKLVCSNEFAKDVKTLIGRFANIFAEEKHRKGIVLTIVGVTLIVSSSLFVRFGEEKRVMDNEKVEEALSKETHGEGWYKEEYLFQDAEGWQYYLEEDENHESCIWDVKKLEFVPDRIMRLVRYKDGERQVLEDLIWEDFYKDWPILYMEEAERIIYKAAPTASITGLKDPVMVSLSLDGADRRLADSMLYHHFENVCEDNGWIYYMGWTNDILYCIKIIKTVYYTQK